MQIICLLIPLTVLGHVSIAYLLFKGKRIHIPINSSVSEISRFRLMIKTHLFFNFFAIVAILAVFSLDESMLVNYAKISILLCMTCVSIIFSSAFGALKIFVYQGLPSLLCFLLMIIQQKGF